MGTFSRVWTGHNAASLWIIHKVILTVLYMVEAGVCFNEADGIVFDKNVKSWRKEARTKYWLWAQRIFTDGSCWPQLWLFDLGSSALLAAETL